MEYEVLARKWRPRTLPDVVGQAHAVRILTHALDSQRLHHAWLFTGTRGVGKTTLARILAKCLSCENGISAQPCDQCDTCQACDAGHFIDLLEIDAASRTRVEDTRDLLDTLRCAPARGRFKICLIDEVHMLSGHSFNALLKTLEEPPAHVKFLLATTDPDRLLTTVLSRCLQLHLHPLSPSTLQQHLAHICQAENIPADSLALTGVALAGKGSLRDALSLLEQATAFAGGELLTEAMVHTLTGTGGLSALPDLLDAIRTGDGAGMLARIRTLATEGADFDRLAAGLLSLLHDISILQAVPGHEAPEVVRKLAGQLTPEETQLYYQIALTGRRDLPFAPDPASGFEMTLLRMLAFVPAAAGRAPVAAAPAPTAEHPTGPANNSVPHNWTAIVSALPLTGMALALATHCRLVRLDSGQAELILSDKHASLLNKNLSARLEKALSDYCGQSTHLKISLTGDTIDTPAAEQSAVALARHKAAEAALQQDEGIQRLVSTFDATLDPASIQASDSDQVC